MNTSTTINNNKFSTATDVLIRDFRLVVSNESLPPKDAADRAIQAYIDKYKQYRLLNTPKQLKRLVTILANSK